MILTFYVCKWKYRLVLMHSNSIKEKMLLDDNLTDSDKVDLLIIFDDIERNVEDIDPEFSKVIDDHYFELI